MLDQRHRHGLRRGVARLLHEVAERRTDRVGKARQAAQQVAAHRREIRQQVVRELRRPLEELTPVRMVEIQGAELPHTRTRALEHLDHLVGSDPGRERNREDRASGKTQVEVEVGDLAADQEVVEGL